MHKKTGTRKSAVGGDITDFIPKKVNGAMGFGTWEAALKAGPTKRKR